MSIIVDGSVSSPELALYGATTAVPDVRLEIVDIVATDPQRPILSFWVSEGDVAAFGAALDSDDSVDDVEVCADTDDRRLYRAVVSERVNVVPYATWVGSGATVVDAHCQAGVWRVRMRFPDRGALQSVVEWAQDNDIAVTLRRLCDEHGTGVGRESGLSREQERTLERAYEMGHYEIPQEATAAEIAETLGVSQQAVSERLRRAYANLIQRHVLEAERPSE